MYTNISIADLRLRGKVCIDTDTRLFHEAMSPGTGSMLLSQVGIRYVYVQVYRNDTRRLWVALKTLHAVLGRL